MSPPARYFVVFLALVHLVCVTGGEALHMLPGLGHFEQTPSGRCYWNGGARDLPLPIDVSPAGAWQAPSRAPGEVLGPDECPICVLVGLAWNQGEMVSVVDDGYFHGLVYVLPTSVVSQDTVAAYGARAPPAAGNILS